MPSDNNWNINLRKIHIIWELRFLVNGTVDIKVWDAMTLVQERVDNYPYYWN